LVNIADANITDYFWDFGVAGTQSDVSTEANPAFVYPTAGTYTVNLQVTTSDGCTSVGSQLIEVNAVPQPDFAFEERCLGQARLFSPLDTSGIVNHFWELRNPEGEVIESSLSANFSYLFNQAGTYELSYRQENELLCSGTSTKSIRINEAPIADFVLSEACVGEPIAVENITELNGNALNSFQWRLGDEVISTDSQLNYIFEESGEYTLSLEVETQGGCLESVSREIRVSPSPTAFFELPQSVGAFPFRLNLMAEGQVAIDNSQFTKNSITSPLGTEGFSRLWTLNGDTISTSSALDYTIEQAGTYLLGLIITNEAGCTAEHYEQVRVRPPSLDISLGNLRLNQDGEFTSFILNISNRGSLIPDRIDLDIDLGAYSVTESLESPLYPEENQNTSLSLKLSEEQLRGLSRICINATAYSADFEDSNPQNNRVCTNIESGFELLEMYPNPAMNQFTVPLIIPESDRLSISLEDSNGRQVRIFSYDLSSGYNEIPIQRESLSSGIYFLRFRFQGEEKIKKIIFQ
jgi:PKD repeat protein